MIERQVEIATPSGGMNTFICHPERGGAHPVLFFYMDAPGIREELRDMARRLAAVGYYVMLPNLYYREGVEELGPLSPDPNSPSRQRITALMQGLTMPMVMESTDALIAFADTDAAADARRIGTLGYCMSGQYALVAAGRHPDRVKAAASLYGAWLVTDQPDSPHLVAKGGKAEVYAAFAEIDQYVPLSMMEPLGQSLQAAGLPHEIELYKGVDHGFAFPQRGAYDRAAAERHWERLFALFGRNLGWTPSAA
jgi:carboxymethylenebutenolidase